MLYRVVMQGHTLGGADVAVVKQHFVRVTGLPAGVAEELFGGMPQVIKRQLSQTDAERIAATLRAIGAAAIVERELVGTEEETSEGIRVVAAPLNAGPPTVIPGCSGEPPAPPCERPIAWVSTVDAEGVANLAPFSYFMAITHDPPTIAFSSSPRAEYAGVPGKKDTLRNVEITREFVVNLVDDALAEAMNVTSGDYPPEVDEFAQAGLVTAPSVKVKAPRVAAAPINMECHLQQIVPIGNRPSHLVIGRIVHLHLRDDVYDAASGRIDMHRLRPVGRLAGNLYSHIHDIFEMKRPSVDYKG